MPALMVGVCPPCQENSHESCMNESSCVCALRQHPHIEQNKPSANHRYIPEPGRE